jgi:hypothetical protein
MNSWRHLPVNVLDLVFDIIADRSINELQQCQLTCKDWSKPAQTRLYKSVIIKNHEQFMNLLTTLCSFEPNPAQQLKNITIEYDDVSLQGLLRLLLLRSPNVESLNANPTVLFVGFFEEILHACARGGCKRLQRVEGPKLSFASDQQVYIDTMYHLRNSLRCLSLNENHTVKSNGITLSLLQILDEFPELRTLEIKMHCMETFYHLGKHTKTCNNLERLELFWDSMVYPNEDMIPGGCFKATYPNIKYLGFWYIPVMKEMLEYIIYAFPNLDVLMMSLPIVTQRSDDTIPNNLWIQFLTFLHSIKGDIFIGSLCIADIPGVLTGYFNTRKTNIRLHISLQSSIVGHPNVQAVNIIKKASDQDISVKVDYPVTHHQYGLSFSTLLCKMGNLLNSLIFSCTEPYNSEFTINSLIWDTICQQCSSLEQLQLDYLTIITDSSTSPLQTNTSIKDIRMNTCNISQELFPVLSIRFPSLSNLCLSDCNRLNFNRRYHEDYHNKLVIEMPNTSLDTLVWIQNIHIFVYKKINLRIDTPAKSYCYIGNEDGSVAESSGISFQKSWNVNTILSLYIQCQEIKKLDVTLKDHHSWHITFTDL